MNHGPDAQGPEEPGRELSPDELALRRMLHSAVDDVEPQDGTLEHLRRAVPARRARKRQAFVGMAAAVLFVGTAIPALIHVSNAGGTDPNTAMAGQSSQAQGGTDQGKYPDGGTGDQRDPGGQSAGPGKHTGKTPRPDTTGDDSTAAGSGTDPHAGTIAPTVPACTAAQLGSATASADAPDSTGVVYGTFRVTNVSATACTVDGPGTVAVTAQGAADQTKLSTVRHVAGDPAAALPDPSLEVAALVLEPGSAYEEKFAFVPSETCPAPGDGTAGGSTGGPSPQPSPSQGPGTGGATDTGGTTGTSTQLYGEDGTADGSITVSHTPKAGAPGTSAPVPDACAGTVYYTGVLAGT